MKSMIMLTANESEGHPYQVMHQIMLHLREEEEGLEKTFLLSNLFFLTVRTMFR